MFFYSVVVTLSCQVSVTKFFNYSRATTRVYYFTITVTSKSFFVPVKHFFDWVLSPVLNTCFSLLLSRNKESPQGGHNKGVTTEATQTKAVTTR